VITVLASRMGGGGANAFTLHCVVVVTGLKVKGTKSTQRKTLQDGYNADDDYCSKSTRHGFQRYILDAAPLRLFKRPTRSRTVGVPSNALFDAGLSSQMSAIHEALLRGRSLGTAKQARKRKVCVVVEDGAVSSSLPVEVERDHVTLVVAVPAGVGVRKARVTVTGRGHDFSITSRVLS
jgi:hypothetical protein